MTLKYRKVIAQSMLQKNEGLYRLGLRSKVGIGKPKDLMGKAIPPDQTAFGEFSLAMVQDTNSVLRKISSMIMCVGPGRNRYLF